MEMQTTRIKQMQSLGRGGWEGVVCEVVLSGLSLVEQRKIRFEGCEPLISHRGHRSHWSPCDRLVSRFQRVGKVVKNEFFHP